jgi:hypothetical protein
MEGLAFGIVFAGDDGLMIRGQHSHCSISRILSCRKPGAKRLGLLRKFLRVGFFQAGKIMELPLDGRQFFKVRV